MKEHRNISWQNRQFHALFPQANRMNFCMAQKMILILSRLKRTDDPIWINSVCPLIPQFTLYSSFIPVLALNPPMFGPTSINTTIAGYTRRLPVKYLHFDCSLAILAI